MKTGSAIVYKSMKQIPGCQGYAVSDDFRIASFHGRHGSFRKFITPFLNSYGYPCVRLYVNKRRKEFKIHSIIAMAFLPEKPSWCTQIRHLDGTRTNYHPSNLAWGTSAENMADRTRHGRTLVGERTNRAKLKERDIPIIRAACEARTHTSEELAKLFGCSARSIRRIATRQAWKHVK